MTVYVVAQLKFTNREAYDRYQARFMDVFGQFEGRLLAADEEPTVVEGIWDREKVVLMSFPDEAAFNEWSQSAALPRDLEGPARRGRFGSAVGERLLIVLCG